MIQTTASRNAATLVEPTNQRERASPAGRAHRPTPNHRAITARTPKATAVFSSPRVGVGVLGGRVDSARPGSYLFGSDNPSPVKIEVRTRTLSDSHSEWREVLWAGVSHAPVSGTHCATSCKQACRVSRVESPRPAKANQNHEFTT